MATCKEISETTRRWQLRATVIIIGIVTMIICCLFLVYFTILLLEDLRGLYRGDTIWQVSTDKDNFLRNMEASIDAGLIGMTDFLIFPPSNNSNGSAPGDSNSTGPQNLTKPTQNPTPHKPTQNPTPHKPTQNPTHKTTTIKRRMLDITKGRQYGRRKRIPTEWQTNTLTPYMDASTANESAGSYKPIGNTSTPFPFPVLPSPVKAKHAIDRERDLLLAGLHKEKFTIFGRIENEIQAVFILLDIILLILAALGLIAGYLLIVGGFQKHRHYLVLWLMISFVVAWGAVCYAIGHYCFGYQGWELDILYIVILALVFIIIVGLHIWAFYAVYKYFVHLWEPAAKPGAPVRNMKLILSRRSD